MRKLALIMALLLALGGTALATPLVDYHLGSVQLDFDMAWSSNSGSVIGPAGSALNQDFSGAGGAGDLSLTVGLGNNMALRLKNNTFTGNTYFWGPVPNTYGWWSENSVTGYVSDSELDFMWQVLPLNQSPVSTTLFIGFDAPVLGAVGNDTNGNLYQMSMISGGFLGGVQLVAPVGSNATTLYASADIGTARWDIGGGVGFGLTPNFDINLGVDYKSYFVSSINTYLNGTISSVEPKIGLSFRF